MLETKTSNILIISGTMLLLLLMMYSQWGDLFLRVLNSWGAELALRTRDGVQTLSCSNSITCFKMFRRSGAIWSGTAPREKIFPKVGKKISLSS
jgi:hypothetical protein